MDKELIEFFENIENNDELKPNFPAYIILIFRENNPKMLEMAIEKLEVKTSELNTIIEEVIAEKNIYLLDILLKNATTEELEYYSQISKDEVRNFIHSKIKYTDEEKEKYLKISQNPSFRRKMKEEMKKYYGNMVEIDELSQKQKMDIVNKILQKYKISI